jgi:nitrile hydratase subunit beta
MAQRGIGKRSAARPALAKKPSAKISSARRASAGRAKATRIRNPDSTDGRKPAKDARRARAEKPLTFRFKPGDRVVTRKDRPKGHCRTPTYLRGKPGVIERCLGHFRNPEQLAYGKPGLPKVGLYMVRYEIPGLWKGYGGPSRDTLVADIYEFWLDPA